MTPIFNCAAGMMIGGTAIGAGVGGAGGGAVFGVVGAVGGSVVPGAGTVAGAAAGGTLGYIGGGLVGGSIGASAGATLGTMSCNVASGGSGGHTEPTDVSTGRTTPKNLQEKLAMEQVKAYPAGKPLTKLTMNDKRWPASEGWVKMQQFVNGVNIHYVRNTVSGAVADFKFK